MNLFKLLTIRFRFIRRAHKNLFVLSAWLGADLDGLVLQVNVDGVG